MKYDDPKPAAIDTWRVAELLTREYGDEAYWWRTVHLLTKHWGQEAEPIARQRAEGFIRRGDLEAAAV